MNGRLSRAHWTAKSAWSNQWKAATWGVVHVEVPPAWFVNPREPRRITFKAFVARLWDDDNLPAAIKPIRDALQGFGRQGTGRLELIHSDGPGSGHQFMYRQVAGKKRGVEITVEVI